MCKPQIPITNDVLRTCSAILHTLPQRSITICSLINRVENTPLYSLLFIYLLTYLLIYFVSHMKNVFMSRIPHLLFTCTHFHSKSHLASVRKRFSVLCRYLQYRQIIFTTLHLSVCSPVRQLICPSVRMKTVCCYYAILQSDSNTVSHCAFLPHRTAPITHPVIY